MAYTKQTWIDGTSIANAERMNHIEDGIYQANKNSLPIGIMLPFGGSNPPEYFLICDGSAVSRTTYADLFNIIGTNYGSGDGETTFNLPDKRGRVSVGLDPEDTDFNAIGKKYGEKTHTLTVEEMPNHNHSYGVSSTGGGQAQNQPGYGGDLTFTENVGSTGGDQPHNNIQPSEVDNWIIKAF